VERPDHANHAELVGLADRDGSVQTLMSQGGMSPDAVNQAMNYLVTSQNVMLSTNQLMAVAGVIVFFAATLIGFAPRPTRTVQPGAGGH